jgi:hypothetical protein
VAGGSEIKLNDRTRGSRPAEPAILHVTRAPRGSPGRAGLCADEKAAAGLRLPIPLWIAASVVFPYGEVAMAGARERGLVPGAKDSNAVALLCDAGRDGLGRRDAGRGTVSRGLALRCCVVLVLSFLLRQTRG